MYLLIFESIGTSELILVGIVALIFLGPRKLPEMARKMGKIMADFRSTTNEFKETWQREVDIEQELKALRVDDIETEVVPRGAAPSEPSAPTVGEIDAEEFQRRSAAAPEPDAGPKPPAAVSTGPEDKRNWL